MDVHNVDIRSYNMSQIHSKETKPEVAVRKYLFSLGFRYRKNDNRLPGCPDIVLPKYKTVIFINGCFWHMHENCRYATIPKTNTLFWEKKLQQNKNHDTSVVKQLNDMGWHVITIWQCEIRGKLFQSKMDKVVEQLIEPHHATSN